MTLLYSNTNTPIGKSHRHVHDASVLTSETTNAVQQLFARLAYLTKHEEHADDHDEVDDVDDGGGDDLDDDETEDDD